MKIVPFNKPKAIWEILSECTTQDILDRKRAEEILDPLEKGQIRISAALLDTFCSDSQEQIQCQVEGVWHLMKLIAQGHITESRVVQKKLKQMDFKTLSLMGDLRENIKEDCYNYMTYEMFKKLLFETSDKELFKLAIVVTSMGEWCEELIDSYMIIGQNEEFSRYVASGFTHWINKKVFEEAAFKMLQQSQDWGTVCLIQLLVEQKELLGDINVQRNILVGALKNNSIQTEVTASLIEALDLPKLLELAEEDRELCQQVIQFFGSLYIDTSVDGAIWMLLEEEPLLLETYINHLESTRFDTLKLLGTKDICEFIKNNETQECMIELYGQKEYERLRKRALTLWEEVYSVALLKKSIEEGLSIYNWCNFIKEHRVVELVETCKDLYGEDSELNWIVEDVLITMGDMETKRHIYEKLKKVINSKERLAEPYSYLNAWGETYSRENNIINKLKVVKQLPFEEVAAFNTQLLGDYNPQIRSGAINALRDRSEEELKSDGALIEKLIERLGDSPFYIRNDALKLCKAKHIKISAACVKEIEMKWLSRNEQNNPEFLKDFKEIQERIISIVPFNKK